MLMNPPKSKILFTSTMSLPKVEVFMEAKVVNMVVVIMMVIRVVHVEAEVANMVAAEVARSSNFSFQPLSGSYLLHLLCA